MILSSTALFLCLSNLPFISAQIAFTLVSNGTSRPFKDGDNIILSVDLPPLSILVETSENVSYAVLDLDDGATVRTEYSEPFFLGGDCGGLPGHVHSLADVGYHTLHTAVFIEDAMVDDALITFGVVETEADLEGPQFIPPPSGPDGNPIGQPVPFVDKPEYEASSGGSLNGDTMLWHKLTLGFTAFPTSATNIVENPTAHYRLDVTFTHPASGKTYFVPGFYAADGNAANSRRKNGSVWLCHFVPDEEGAWEWSASFLAGLDVAALGQGESASYFDGATGSFIVLPSDKTGKDFRAKGRLEYVPGMKYQRHAGTWETYLQMGIGMDDMLANPEFVNTPTNTSTAEDFVSHKSDYNWFIDESWQGGMGQGLAGALNFLASEGVNSIAVKTLGGPIYPFLSLTKIFQYDVAKLSQWETVLRHANDVGIQVQLNLDDSEDMLGETLTLSVAHRIYLREMVARFSHLTGLSWELGSLGVSSDTFAGHLKSIDPYDHPIMAGAAPVPRFLITTFPDIDGITVSTDEEGIYEEGVKDKSLVTAVHTFDNATSPTTDILWARLMAGGGVIDYDTSCGVDCGDYRKSKIVSNISEFAFDFFSKLPVESMSTISPEPWTLMDATVAVIYIGSSNTTTPIVLPSLLYTVSWYDASSGGSLLSGSVASLRGSPSANIGLPPVSISGDESWVALLTTDSFDLQGAFPTPTTAPTSAPGLV